MIASDLMKLQLAMLDQDMDELEAHIRLQTYIDAGLEPELAAAAASVDIHLDEMSELRVRVEQLERTVVLLAQRVEGMGKDD